MKIVPGGMEEGVYAVVKRLVIDQGGGQPRWALLENEKLIEVGWLDEQSGNENIQKAGSLYKGKVVRVLPGMEAAFVDIGQGKNAFLHVDDLFSAHLEKQPVQKPSIEALISPGEELLVQVAKEAHKGKGARVTTRYSLPGRWMVYMPHADYIAVSKKIVPESLKENKKQIFLRNKQGDEGFIVRTAAMKASEEEIRNEIIQLRRLWTDILTQSEQIKAPSHVHNDMNEIQRAVRDLFTEDITELITNDQTMKEWVEHYLHEVDGDLLSRVKWSDHPDLFHFYGIAREIRRVSLPRIELQQGGHLILDYTEALTVIDVNTGKYTGEDDLEKTMFHTNMDAAIEIGRLIRLLDIGGIIIIDFIDMNEDAHREQVVTLLSNILEQDRTKSVIMGWTNLGLLEMTRQKKREHIFPVKMMEPK